MDLAYNVNRTAYGVLDGTAYWPTCGVDASASETKKKSPGFPADRASGFRRSNSLRPGADRPGLWNIFPFECLLPSRRKLRAADLSPRGAFGYGAHRRTERSLRSGGPSATAISADVQVSFAEYAGMIVANRWIGPGIPRCRERVGGGKKNIRVCGCFYCFILKFQIRSKSTLHLVHLPTSSARPVIADLLRTNFIPSEERRFSARISLHVRCQPPNLRVSPGCFPPSPIAFSERAKLDVPTAAIASGFKYLFFYFCILTTSIAARLFPMYSEARESSHSPSKTNTAGSQRTSRNVQRRRVFPWFRRLSAAMSSCIYIHVYTQLSMFIYIFSARIHLYISSHLQRSTGAWRYAPGSVVRRWK